MMANSLAVQPIMSDVIVSIEHKSQKRHMQSCTNWQENKQQSTQHTDWGSDHEVSIDLSSFLPRQLCLGHISSRRQLPCTPQLPSP